MTETVSGSARAGGHGGRSAAPGLRLERVFTTPGIHPYDEVDWERRDVVMTNWRDGAVIFEQKGVEFPDFWSVNATNIVTTKYFRGAVGTPQREWSLKQLIDRVVKTYRRAGEDHGYFATPEDAEIFEHELTWAVLHQVFSFNSPVWFNVGTSAPQQVSACQPYDALVSTPSGSVPIGKLVEDDAVGSKVYDARGLTRVVATKANGVKDVLRIHTKAGDTLDVTADHLVWRCSDPDDGEFVEAGHLVSGDALLRVVPEMSGADATITDVSRIEHLGPMKVYDIQTDSGEYLSENLRVHNCFILSVDDEMDSILNWYREEGLIFKGGSGAGLNLSRIRSSKELLSSGGTASGPVSFMRGADASAGTIKSGGATRRAAKMVILDVDHPDIEEFIETKAREEEKIRALRDAGFDMDLGGKDIASVQYQNANNSVRVSDEFMRAVEEGRSFALRARTTGEVIEEVDAADLFHKMAKAAWECADPGIQYDDTINDWHTSAETGRITASNPCSEYLHLDNSSCNLASLNLLKFLRDDGSFDAETFAKVVELVITAMDISICFADFPTEAIRDTTRAYRQLGVGYANLGALLMATGHGYDSEGGRALAAAITSLMTGTAYKQSAKLAGSVGSYDGYARNAEPHRRVMRKHAAANDAVRAVDDMGRAVLRAATKAWSECLTAGEKNGWRNAQASVLAPTGCLTGDTLVTTGRGLTRLCELGDVHGARWQHLHVEVSTDEGARTATRFFVNGEEPTRRVVTEGGYSVQGTLTHRLKVVDSVSGSWVWKRLAEIAPGDVVPLQLGIQVGEVRAVPLSVPDHAHDARDRTLSAPDVVTEELAELVGYFMGDGSLHASAITMRVADEDLDVVARLRVLSKSLFGLEPVVTAQQGYHEVTLRSVRLARWWQAAGFATASSRGHRAGEGRVSRVPSALLETNDPAVYAAFVRGLFEAAGGVTAGVPSLSTSSTALANEVRTLLLALGLATTTSGRGPVRRVHVRNRDHARAFDEVVGFIGERKARRLHEPQSTQPDNQDRVHLPRSVWDQLVPAGHPLRPVVVQSLEETGGVSRTIARRLFEDTLDARLGHGLGYLFESVAVNEDGGVQPTYDLSVPDNVTYVAAGFISHNTIGLMMDCDTTGVEPDLALVKFKKLVGGGSMQIVNQTVPRALAKLGYQQEQIEAIVEYVAEHGHVVDAPGLRPEHYEVFDCAMGERAIRPMGHVHMMAAVQPFISGAISKCVVGETLLTTEDGLIRIGSMHRGETADSFRNELIEVASLGEPAKTNAFYYGGVQSVREVSLRSGHRVTGTPNHRLLVATPHGPDWRHLSDVREGDYVATQYGADMWSPLPARFDDFRPSRPHGSQETIRVPGEMTEELAFLLGAYAAEGHTTTSTWTVVITNSVEAVERVRRAWHHLFGVEARIERRDDRCSQVIASSKAVVEFLRYLGCGSRASDKRIPDAVLRSPKPMVLEFLRGLALDAYVHVPSAAAGQAKWAICLDSPELLDDLQAVLTNLGVVHSRIRKHNKASGKTYDEVYASGQEARTMALLVPFLEPDKAANARKLQTMSFAQSTSEWAQNVIRDNVHFSPVSRVSDAGEREVFDISVPTTHAFVGNGIVNHNTVNLPETARIEDIENVYTEGWKLGLKALAVYRDNCKVGQPLSDAKGKRTSPFEQPVPDVEYRPIRKRLPKSRPSKTVSFTVGGAEGYMTASSYPDDGLGEIFLKMSKQGSTLAGMMDAFSIAISIGLQYGVPLETYVQKFVNMRFEPAGMTDDPDVRIAASIMDYIFRRLALDFLPFDERAALGVYTAEERARQLETGSYEPAAAGDDQLDIEALAQSAPRDPKATQAEPAPEASAEPAPAKPAPAHVGSSTELIEAQQGRTADAPLCFTCGTKMRPAGSCYVCEGCGSTSGCS